MDNENIKEILDNLKILMLSYENYISLDDYVKLKDYITNLQQENEKLQTTVNDCKQRIRKAVEYIKENNCPDPYCLTGDLLNILKGDDENGESKIDTKR